MCRELGIPAFPAHLLTPPNERVEGLGARGLGIECDTVEGEFTPKTFRNLGLRLMAHRLPPCGTSLGQCCQEVRHPRGHCVVRPAGTGRLCLYFHAPVDKHSVEGFGPRLNLVFLDQRQLHLGRHAGSLPIIQASNS